MTFSCCMIVKNEEKVLARCLDSISDLMDEIIIVDTGSTDHTKEIARRYTDKIFDFVWVQDFSAARNYSFEKASMDYIYVADADEVLDEENRKRFRQLKQTILPEIEIVQMKYCNQLSYNTTYNFDEEYRPKLYKRVRNFIWLEPVHEMVRLEPILFDSDIEILHMPESNHAGRDFSTFLAMIERKQHLSKRLHHMYAMELFIAGEENDFIEAKNYFLQSMEDPTRGLDEVKEAACIVAKAARLSGDLATLMKASIKDIAAEGCAEMCYELGCYYQNLGDFKEAVIWYYNAAFEAPSILNIHTSTDWPRYRLAECEESLGNVAEATKYRKLAEEI